MLLDELIGEQIIFSCELLCANDATGAPVTVRFSDSEQTFPVAMAKLVDVGAGGVWIEDAGISRGLVELAQSLGAAAAAEHSFALFIPFQKLNFVVAACGKRSRSAGPRAGAPSLTVVRGGHGNGGELGEGGGAE